MMRTAILLGLLRGACAVTIASMDQGAEFTKCINITDFEGKTLDDDITLIDREDTGCCPAASVPGAKMYSGYEGAQIVCGFKDDGTIALSTGSSNNVKTCTYNKCYVHKQGLPCADDSKQLLNGCCKATTGSNTGFKSDCKNYQYTFNSVYSDSTKYCSTYHKNYGTKGNKGTTDKTDDQKDGKFQPDKYSAYAACEGGSGGSSPAPAPAATSAAATVAVASGLFLATVAPLL